MSGHEPSPWLERVPRPPRFQMPGAACLARDISYIIDLLWQEGEKGQFSQGSLLEDVRAAVMEEAPK